MAEVKHLDAKELPAVLKRVLNKSITIKTMYPPALSLHLWVPSFPRVPESPRESQSPTAAADFTGKISQVQEHEVAGPR